MRSFATLLIVGGLLAIAATFSVSGPRLLTDAVAATIRGADEIPYAKCQTTTTDCDAWNEAHEVISNSDCAGGGLSLCDTCENADDFLRACQTDPTSSCERDPDGTDCGVKFSGFCQNGSCSGFYQDGDCDDGHFCTDPI